MRQALFYNSGKSFKSFSGRERGIRSHLKSFALKTTLKER
jgi:hypothetical protein